jgi:hypothetical protein
MSDLAPFVAAVVRDKVVSDLQNEVEQLRREKDGLQELASQYKSLYETTSASSNLQHQNPSFRTVSLVLLPPSSPPGEDAQGPAHPAPLLLPLPPPPQVLASCRVNLDHALSNDDGSGVALFEGSADANIALLDLPRVELRIGSTAACRVASELSVRSVMFFACPASGDNFVRINLEHGPDLRLEAGIGPLTVDEYCDLFGVEPRELSSPSDGYQPPTAAVCGRMSVHDAASRPLAPSRLQALLQSDGSSSSTRPPKFVKFMFDDNRMSTDYLFEFLDTPYDAAGAAGGGGGGAVVDNVGDGDDAMAWE